MFINLLGYHAFAINRALEEGEKGKQMEEKGNRWRKKKKKKPLGGQ